MSVPGKNDDGSRSPEAFRDYRQGMAALALRLAGASYAEITEALGLGNVADAYEMVESTLASQVQEHDREALRHQEAARLDRLQRGVWQKATDAEHPEHLVAVKTVLAISESRRRLLGLDAPTTIAVHSPTQDEIDRWIATVHQAQYGDLIELEATVVDVTTP